MLASLIDVISMGSFGIFNLKYGSAKR